MVAAAQPGILPIPGTVRIAHLEENVVAAGLSLGPDEIGELDALTIRLRA